MLTSAFYCTLWQRQWKWKQVDKLQLRLFLQTLSRFPSSFNPFPIYVMCTQINAHLFASWCTSIKLKQKSHSLKHEIKKKMANLWKTQANLDRHYQIRRDAIYKMCQNLILQTRSNQAPIVHWNDSRFPKYFHNSVCQINRKSRGKARGGKRQGLPQRVQITVQ